MSRLPPPPDLITSNDGPWPTHVDVGADVEWEDTLQAGRVIGLLEAGAYADAGFFALLGTIHDAFAQELLWAYLKAGGAYTDDMFAYTQSREENSEVRLKQLRMAYRTGGRTPAVTDVLEVYVGGDADDARYTDLLQEIVAENRLVASADEIAGLSDQYAEHPDDTLEAMAILLGTGALVWSELEGGLDPSFPDLTDQDTLCAVADDDARLAFFVAVAPCTSGVMDRVVDTFSGERRRAAELVYELQESFKVLVVRCITGVIPLNDDVHLLLLETIADSDPSLAYLV